MQFEVFAAFLYFLFHFTFSKNNHKTSNKNNKKKKKRIQLLGQMNEMFDRNERKVTTVTFI